MNGTTQATPTRRSAWSRRWSVARQSLGPAQIRLPWHVIVAASLAGAATISVLSVTGDTVGTPILIAAFGSSCVLVFLMPDTPLARPVNVIGGHVISAFVGLVVLAVLPVNGWSIGISVGAAMAAMASARVIHPPAGGTPIAVMLTHAGWDYLFTPVLAGAVILCGCALVYRFILHRMTARSGKADPAHSE